MSPDGSSSFDRFLALRARRTVRWLGLMSGTSCDGIDSAIVDLSECDDGIPMAKLIAGEVRPFATSFSAELSRDLDGRGSARTTAESAARWDRRLGEAFASAAQEAMAKHGPVDAIALSGHTFAHHPEVGATLQVGSPSIVAAATETPVVGAFRTSDVAHGGEGAPLVPAGDRVWFASDDGPVAVLNLGGIGNLTWLPDRRGMPSARDTGPSNLVLDLVVREATGEPFDQDGRRARTGEPHGAWIDRWNEHPFFSSSRRTTGREEFGRGWVEAHRAELETLSLEDRLATLAGWVASNVVRVLGEWIAPGDARLLVGGGGARNEAILAALLAHGIEQLEVLDRERHGVGGDLREAAAFAVLGHEFLHQRPAAFPTTTGCRAPGPIGALWIPR
ncbi:MAG: anhydro-N-acetylmuramic acid kinase [Planctomycetes bacterium]|nr:anhydro-N-acetylmuramic acid kinase [Planctomycetota bacterium]